ncbi:MAG: hypothetical protein M1832_002775 [Thelocarpon impressellum]|nr:MAG: hypothetical protein M1832_002775 [Thelocarpon impressellum]
MAAETVRPRPAEVAGTAVDDKRAEREEEENKTGRPESAPSSEDEGERQSQSSPSAHSPAEGSAPPPLPSEAPPGHPPLPAEAPPPEGEEEDGDDGWQPVWEETAQAFYFYNSRTGESTWTNPRIPAEAEEEPEAAAPRPYGGYDPSIHGSYDPTASYAQPAPDPPTSTPADPSELYAAVGTFNRFTGKFQAPEIGPQNHSDEAKSRRQMAAFFDVDAAANSHDGRSLRAERAGKKLSRKEVKEFREKRRSRKEERRRAWLRD